MAMSEKMDGENRAAVPHWVIPSAKHYHTSTGCLTCYKLTYRYVSHSFTAIIRRATVSFGAYAHFTLRTERPWTFQHLPKPILSLTSLRTLETLRGLQKTVTGWFLFIRKFRFPNKGRHQEGCRVSDSPKNRSWKKILQTRYQTVTVIYPSGEICHWNRATISILELTKIRLKTLDVSDEI